MTTLRPETKQKVQEHAQAMVELLGLEQGHVELHCDRGRPTRLHITDKSVKFEESPRK